MSYLFDQLAPVPLESADQAQKDILIDAQRQVGFLPNMYLDMVNVPEFLQAYLSSYNAFRSRSEFSAAEQEVVFLAISYANGCNYCSAAHATLAANHSGVPEDVLNAIRAGQTLPDAKLNILFQLTQAMNNSRGKPNSQLIEQFLTAGYQEVHIMLIILAISCKVLSNYSNHFFSPELDEMFSQYKID